MKPQIFITSAEGKKLPRRKDLHPSVKETFQGKLNGNTVAMLSSHLSIPPWETQARRPSCLPNDTEANLRPKVRKFSSYDLSINDTIDTDSFDLNSSSAGGSADSGGVTVEDLMDIEPPPCFEHITKWIEGDAQYLTDFLDRWPLVSLALPLKVINTILRTIGAPILANNPFSGVLILTAISLDSPAAALWGLSALGVALLVALLLKQPQHIVSSGQITQHGFMLGVLTGHAFQHKENFSMYPTAIILTAAVALSVLLGNAISSWLSQTNLPGLTLPYIVIGLCLVHTLGDYSIQEIQKEALFNNTYPLDLQWSMVLQGVIRGAGQVYGCFSLTSSSLVYMALFVFSPIAFMHALLGSLVGAMCGVLVSEAPYHSVYAGHFGGHSSLTSLSLGGFFFVLNLYSSFTAVAGAMLSVLLYHTLNRAVPNVLTAPHVLATLILLHARIRGGLLKRVDLIYITYPEMHRRLFRPGNAIEDCGGA